MQRSGQVVGFNPNALHFTRMSASSRVSQIKYCLHSQLRILAVINLHLTSQAYETIDAGSQNKIWRTQWLS
jgi:hypothetical protein